MSNEQTEEINKVVDGRIKDTLIPVLELKITKTINSKMYLIMLMVFGIIVALAGSIYINGQRMTSIEINNKTLTKAVEKSVLDNKGENDKLRKEIKEFSEEVEDDLDGIENSIVGKDDAVWEKLDEISDKQTIIFWELDDIIPGIKNKMIVRSGNNVKKKS